jgi:hypothetical protein
MEFDMTEHRNEIAGKVTIKSDGDDCYPGDVARSVRASLQADMKKVERQFALRLPKAG